MIHTCHAFGCPRHVPRELFMCAHHWRMVPKAQQLEVLRTYSPGQCDDGHPSREYINAASAARQSVSIKEAVGN